MLENVLSIDLCKVYKVTLQLNEMLGQKFGYDVAGWNWAFFGLRKQWERNSGVKGNIEFQHCQWSTSTVSEMVRETLRENVDSRHQPRVP